MDKRAIPNRRVVRLFALFGVYIVIGLLPTLAYAAEGSGMPQFDLSTFPTQLTWLGITLGIFYLMMRQIALPRIADVLEARQNRIDGDLDRAAEIKEEAEEALVAYEETVTASLLKAQELKREMIADFSEQAARTRLELGERLLEEILSAERQIEEEKTRSLGEIRHVSAELVHASVGKLTGIELSEQEVSTAITCSVSKE